MHPVYGKLANLTFSLRQLISGGSYIGCGDIQFREITSRAQSADPHTLFVALSGSDHAAGQYLKLAEEKQACGVVTDSPLPDLSIPQYITANVRQTYGLLCQGMFSQPAKHLKITGVTGTNGKTTITWMLRSIFRDGGLQAGLLGTIEYDDGLLQPEPARLTTPDAAALAQWMSRMVQVETSHLAMEISSHALDQYRIAGIELELAIISNITRDHLDYHGDFESYLRAKLQIAKYRKFGVPLIINGDDRHLNYGLKSHGIEHGVVKVGYSADCDYRIHPQSKRHSTSSGTAAELNGPGLCLSIQLPLAGAHNVMNGALAAVAAHRMGCSEAAIANGLKSLQPPPGRMQSIKLGQPFTCFVDYAHTPDAIEKAITAAREQSNGKIICVLGAGGNRDQEKRPLMGYAASGADTVILTADNSRNESTAEIMSQIETGISSQSQVIRLSERDEAIQCAIEMAKPGDCVLILGKGHERSQEIGDKILDFDDVVSAEKSIKQLNSAPYTTQEITLKSA